VLRALGLGDLLTSVPAMRAVRRAMPDHEIVLAAPPALEPLVRLAGVADRLLATSGLEPVRWDGPAPDVAVNLHGKGPESHRLLTALGPADVVAFSCPEAGVDGPHWDADEHEVLRWCRLVTVAGWPADPVDLRLPSPDRPPAVADAVVVHPGAASLARRWPAERFAAVARWAAGKGFPVVLTGNDAERALALDVCRMAGLAPSAVLAGRTDLAGLAAQVGAARVVVCGDTGVGHLASALGRPSVLLFGPTPPSRWGPPGTGPHTVIWRGSTVGDPAADLPDPALLRVTVDEVLGEVRALLRRPALPAAGTTPGSGPGPRRPRPAAPSPAAHEPASCPGSAPSGRPPAAARS